MPVIGSLTCVNAEADRGNQPRCHNSSKTPRGGPSPVYANPASNAAASRADRGSRARRQSVHHTSAGLDSRSRRRDRRRRAVRGAEPRVEAALDLLAMVDVVDYMAVNAADFLAAEPVEPASMSTKTKRLTHAYRHDPVVGVITPGPFTVPLIDSIAALAAGAAVVIKPSEVQGGTEARAGRRRPGPVAAGISPGDRMLTNSVVSSALNAGPQNSLSVNSLPVIGNGSPAAVTRSGG
ncbi:MAG TPA: aldehyde dehydrogenase family protein [Aldersonia sp.]